jgi:hypothetical protein
MSARNACVTTDYLVWGTFVSDLLACMAVDCAAGPNTRGKS